MKSLKTIDSLMANDYVRFGSVDTLIGTVHILSDQKALRSIILPGTVPATTKIPELFRKEHTPLIAAVQEYLVQYFSAQKNPEKGLALESVDLPGRNIVLQTGTGISIPLSLNTFSVNEIRVCAALMGVRPGETVSYIRLAEMAGFPRAARFAGTVMAKNLFPLLIPCHRVIRADGTPGLFSSGTNVKKFLLEHEAGKTL